MVNAVYFSAFLLSLTSICGILFPLVFIPLVLYHLDVFFSSGLFQSKSMQTSFLSPKCWLNSLSCMLFSSCEHSSVHCSSGAVTQMKLTLLWEITVWHLACTILSQYPHLRQRSWHCLLSFAFFPQSTFSHLQHSHTDISNLAHSKGTLLSVVSLWPCRVCPSSLHSYSNLCEAAQHSSPTETPPYNFSLGAFSPTCQVRCHKWRLLDSCTAFFELAKSSFLLSIPLHVTCLFPLHSGISATKPTFYRLSI